MLDRVNARSEGGGTEDWEAAGQRWVSEARKHAPGLDSLLTFAYRLEASRIAFQTGHSPWLRVHGRNRRIAVAGLDEADIAQIVNHLYGEDGTARLQGGSDFDVSYEISLSRTERLRFRLTAARSGF